MMLKKAQLLVSAILFFCGSAFAEYIPLKTTVKLDKTIGYRIGDIITVRVNVGGLPEGFIFEKKSMPPIGAKLDKFFEFRGYEIEDKQIVLKLQIFRLANSVSYVSLPLPKLVWTNGLQAGTAGAKIIKLNLPASKILFGPISAADSVEILKSMAPPLLDSMRENGPVALMTLGIVIAVFSLFIMIFNAVEKRNSPKIHPYIIALRKLKKLKKQPESVWVDEGFKIFHEAIDARFGKTMFSHDPDAKYLNETGRKLLALSDSRLYGGVETGFSAESVISGMKDFFTQMIWEES